MKKRKCGDCGRTLRGSKWVICPFCHSVNIVQEKAATKEPNYEPQRDKSAKLAVGFEIELREVINKYLQQGITVANATGVMSVLKADIEFTYIMKSPGFADKVRETVFSTKIEGN